MSVLSLYLAHWTLHVNNLSLYRSSSLLSCFPESRNTSFLWPQLHNRTITTYLSTFQKCLLILTAQFTNVTASLPWKCFLEILKSKKTLTGGSTPESLGWVPFHTDLIGPQAASSSTSYLAPCSQIKEIENTMCTLSFRNAFVYPLLTGLTCKI